MLNERVTASSADRLVRLVASIYAPALGRVGVVNARPSNEIIPSCSVAARPSMLSGRTSISLPPAMPVLLVAVSLLLGQLEIQHDPLEAEVLLQGEEPLAGQQDPGLPVTGVHHELLQ